MTVTLFRQHTGPEQFRWSFAVNHSSHSFSGYATADEALAGARRYLGHDNFLIEDGR